MLVFVVLLLVILSQRVVLLDLTSTVTYAFRWHLLFMLAVSTAHCDLCYLLVMASVMAVALLPDPGAPDHACAKQIPRVV